ncbi:hypothetical protein H5410_004438 [Solanum commersonii]|uniref:Uncharacterized protein n=1 Tax=Solanum commersonii TaxID=4109 RepID=A0A9J6B7S8_SOLCO|nr:hypothetical protein H5410_004438 [Solanum commersonii]
MRRPTRVVRSNEPSRVNISKQASVSTTHSAHQSHNASTHMAPQSGYTISTPIVVPSSSYQTLQGYSHLGRGSTIPLASANAHSPQLGDRDNFWRLVIEPLGYNLRSDVGMAKIILKCIGTHYNGVYSNWSSIPLNTQGQMFNEFKRSEIGKMARASEKGGSLHTGGAISQEKELGRPIAIAEMFKDMYIRISQECCSTLPLESQDRPFTQEENENLWKQSASEPIRGSVYGYPEKVYQKKKSWYCGSSSSSVDGGDRETISAMESKIAYLNAELAVVAKREKKREEREKKREEKERRRLRQERSCDGSDQEGDENNKSDKESEGNENGKSDKESEGDE